VGASPETDLSILSLAGGLYHRFGLKRVYYSAYVPVSANPLLPAITTTPPLLREHRIYQADWLLRFYGFRPDEVLSPEQPNLDESLDPKTSWALRHLDLFPLDVNRASYEELLRTPGIGVLSAKRLLTARKGRRLDEDDLKKLGVVMKRARYFLECKGFSLPSLDARALRRLLTPPPPPAWKTRQLSLEF
jgi:predicted DNA-binding helix-hairpin-helix protein